LGTDHEAKKIMKEKMKIGQQVSGIEDLGGRMGGKE